MVMWLCGLLSQARYTEREKNTKNHDVGHGYTNLCWKVRLYEPHIDADTRTVFYCFLRLCLYLPTGQDPFE